MRNARFVIYSLGDLQNGRFRDEDAGGRVDAGKKDRQDIPANGQKQGREIVARRIYRRSKK